MSHPADAPTRVDRTVFGELAPGRVRPTGWLADQLRLQADGLTGALEEIWPDVGPDSAWLGGTGEDWERGPYYLDGLVPLAHALGDEALLVKARKWVDAILASQRPDGGFGPDSNADWWPRMVVLKALIQHADATGDERIAGFLTSYLRYQSTELHRRPIGESWDRFRSAENAIAIAWLHDRTGEPWLADLAQLLLEQTHDWGRYFTEFPYREITRKPINETHVVNIAMGVKAPAVRYLFDGDPAHREAVEAGLANLDRYHGQVHGMFSGDEHLAGRAPTRGVELCAVVEMMYSLEQLIRIWGSAEHADRLERIAYNLLPAAMTADVTAHQYHQQANQVLVSIAQRDWTAAGDDAQIFGLEPNYGCCTANLHQGWPKLVRSFWLETAEGGLAAVVHGPSIVRWASAAGEVEIEATTDYPFGETIRYDVRSAPGGAFPLLLRVPDWCEGASLSINGVETPAESRDGFLRVDRAWLAGDVVEFRLPATPRLLPRDDGASGVALGALVLAFSPGEIWERIPGSPAFGDWEVRPRRSWGVALAADDDAARAAKVERHAPGAQPFALRTGAPLFGIEGVPVKVWLPGRMWSGWPMAGNSAADPAVARRLGLVGGSMLAWTIPLVPYGSARIRIAEFPNFGPPPATPDASDPVD